MKGLLRFISNNHGMCVNINQSVFEKKLQYSEQIITEAISILETEIERQDNLTQEYQKVEQIKNEIELIVKN